MTHFMPDNSDHAATPIGLLSASIRREREKLGLTVTELAKRAGIAKSTLSQLEGGAGNPSLETLWSLAMALDVPVSRLIAQPRMHVQVIRANEGIAAVSEQANYTATLLAALQGYSGISIGLTFNPVNSGAPEHICPVPLNM
mgnify:CR=1 FL=1